MPVPRAASYAGKIPRVISVRYGPFAGPVSTFRIGRRTKFGQRRFVTGMVRKNLAESELKAFGGPPCAQTQISFVVDGVEILSNFGNGVNLVEAGRLQFSGLRHDVPIALPVVSPQKQPTTGIGKAIVGRAGPCKRLRTFVEVLAQRRQHLFVQRRGLCSKTARFKQQPPIVNLTCQPNREFVGVPLPTRRRSRIHFHDNRRIVSLVQRNCPNANPLVVDHERKTFLTERVIGRPSITACCQFIRRYGNVGVAEMRKE
jgi:hypothetical protein